VAIDTAAKRRRALGIGRPGTLPLPDGTIDGDDRAGLLGQYFAGAVDDNYPTIPVRTTISQIDDGVVTDQTAAGTLRSVDLNANNVYRLLLVHPLITVAQRDQVVTFYDNHRVVEFPFSPLIDAYTYLCRFEAEPERETIDGVLFNVSVILQGVRQ